MNARTYFSNMTPLHYASQYGHLSVVEYLVNQKADINALSNECGTLITNSFDHKAVKNIISENVYYCLI